jgi:hypothetical protein
MEKSKNENKKQQREQETTTKNDELIGLRQHVM